MAWRIAKYLGTAITTVVLVFAFGFALLQTSAGKTWFAAEIAALLAGPGEEGRASGVSGVVPIDFRVAAITVSNAMGPRLSISDAHIQLGLSELFTRRVAFDLSAARIAVLRPGPAATGPTDWQRVLHPPLGLELGRLEIGALELGAPVLGTAVTVGVIGRGAVADGKAAADLDVTRSDGTPGALRLHLAYDGVGLALHVAVSEPTGTVLAALLHSDESLPLDLSLDGDGPLDAWRGQIKGHAGSAADIDWDFTVAGADPYRLSLAGKVQALGVLPRSLRLPFGGPIALVARGTVAADKATLEQIAVTGPFGALIARGNYEFASGGIAGSADLAMPDLAPLVPLLGPIAGTGKTQITLGGTLAHPTIDATLQVERFASSEGEIALARAALSLRPDGDPLTTPSTLSASGRIEQLVPSTGPFPAGLGDAIDWRITGRLDPQKLQIVADDIAIDSAGVTFAATATAARDGATGEARIAVPEVARLGDGLPSGAMSLAADFRADADGSGVASLSGNFDSGGNTASRLEGTARRAVDGRLDADVTVSLLRLAALDPRLAGAANATIHLAGPPEALAGTATVEAPSLAVVGERIEGLTAQLALAGLTPPAGHLDLRLRARGIEATVAADGAATQDGGWSVTRFAANAGGARLDGNAARVKDRIDGALHGLVADLAPLSRAAGMEFTGHAELDAKLAGTKAAVTLDVTGLARPEDKIAARRLRLVADLGDIFTRPTGHAEATISEASAGSAALSEGKITATSDRAGHFALTLAARGTLPQPFTLTAGAGLVLDRGAVDLRVDRLGGTVGSDRIELAAALAIAWRDGAGRFSNLTLRLGAGRLTGEGALQGSAISLHLTAKDLPLPALARLGGLPSADGVLGFDLTLSGTRAAPQGRLVIDGENLRFAAASHPDAPPLGLVSSALWHDGRVEIEGRLAGPQNAAIGWRGSAPLTLAAQGFAWSLPPAGAVTLRVEGAGELADIADLLPLGEDRIAGHVVVDVTVAGTVEHPDAKGSVTVSKGRYESLAIGGTLTGLGFALVGDREHLVLRDFAAGDGERGSLRGSGAIDLAAMTIDAAAELQHFRALRRDEATAVASGTVKLAGPVDAPRVEAALTIEQAEIAVPERLAQSVRPVDAVIINSKTGAIVTPQAPPSRPVLLAVTLAVTVDAPGKVFVRGRGLDSEWRGRVAIAGTARAPILTGALEVVNGTYEFLGKSLVLTRGKITFFGGQPIDPVIAIEAQAQSSDITAIVGIAGTATRPTIKLSSEPQLPRDEILARVLFGTSMSQISPAQGLELASAAASLAGGPSLDVLGTIRRHFGLDRLSLGSAPGTVVPGIGVPSMSGQQAVGPATGLGTTPLGPGGPSGVGGSALNAGKYVANGVYVGVSQGLGTSTSTVTATVDVTRHISIDTEAGQASGSGIGINWKLDY